MPGEVITIQQMQGLSEREVLIRRQQFGKNSFRFGPTHRFVHIVWDVLKEPMFLMLVAACTLYFILGQMNEGFIMLAAMCLVTAISIYQEVKSAKALEALKQLTEPRVRVIRNAVEMDLNSEELVPGDVVILEEGARVPADAVILQENDLSVNEALLTGESLPVEKKAAQGGNLLYQGTTINSGKCYAQVSATGNRTVLGKLGRSVSRYSVAKTLLQQQTDGFVKKLALFGIIAFTLIVLFNFIESRNFTGSLLLGLTLAMAAIPEEIPVAFSSFMALGAYYLSRSGVISRQPQVIENLGAVTVICLDKTGTLTENDMTVESVYDFESGTVMEPLPANGTDKNTVLYHALLASETNPFDPMEKAIWRACGPLTDAPGYVPLPFIYEYPLQGQPPMMTHVYRAGRQNVLAAAKGAVERIIKACRLNDDDTRKILDRVRFYASKGCRVLAVAGAVHQEGALPLQQDDFNWSFKGLISFYDPPKPNSRIVLRQFYDAGIRVKLLTGDHAVTAVHIAQQVGIRRPEKFITGEAVMALDERALQQTVREHNVFARMFPDAKLKVINALKAAGDIVAMTGDGVNDGPALKSAQVGIAMGKRGTEIARQSSGIILTDDDLARVVEAIRQGRKIFSNLKKAIRYIISIHIPIILTASLPLVLGWKFPNVFTPVHVIFLELIMGPTCSIFFEREPVEENIMRQPPREKTTGLFTPGEFLLSVVQGLAITAGVLLPYYVYMHNNYPLPQVRTIVFSTLIISNILLTFANRSFSENLLKTARYKNNLAAPVLLISISFLVLVHATPFARNIFQLAPISASVFVICCLSALISVFWFELYKTYRKKNH